ncbi:DUF6153 family protein [Streptomyces sp. NPDC093111]|uniref:DUF6153 family protein n=1 Tax=Streptomyces sp. NPDC093111 TaxID=3154978 RepID=UPI0034165B41
MHVGRAGRSATRAGGALAHLLLVVVLALGVFVMHSVGHPEGSSGNDGTARTMSAPPGSVAAQQHHGGGSLGMSTYESMDGSTYDDATHGSTHGSGMGMDMTTLCVAVLGVWLLAALLRAALGRRADGIATFLSRLLPFLGPNAPPRPPDLAQLSILRI